jgi:hypothetical protein
MDKCSVAVSTEEYFHTAGALAARVSLSPTFAADRLCLRDFGASRVAEVQYAALISAMVERRPLELAGQTYLHHHSLSLPRPAAAALTEPPRFAAFDLANHRSIASPKSAQLLLTGRSNSRAPLSSRASGERSTQSDIERSERDVDGWRFRANGAGSCSTRHRRAPATRSRAAGRAIGLLRISRGGPGLVL